MTRSEDRTPGRVTPSRKPAKRAGRIRARLLAACLVLALVLGAGLAAADEYDSQRSGHPLRIIAYAAHPIGVIVDTLIFRPAHWILRWEPLRVLFGHKNDDDY